MKNEKHISTAPNKYRAVIGFSLKTKSPTMASGMVALSPTVTINGDVRSMALAQQKSEMNVMTQLTRMMDSTLGVDGSSNVSLPVKCSTMSTGHRNTRVNNPTNPKKIFMLILDSSCTFSFNRVEYTP